MTLSDPTLSPASSPSFSSSPFETLPISVAPGATPPTRGSLQAIGYDLYAHLTEPLYLGPGRRVLVPTGVRVAIPPGHYGRIAPRSGLAVKNGIDVLAGVVDSDYRGVVMVALINHGQVGFTIYNHTRIAQLILERATVLPIEIVDNLDETERQEDGFGSTGQ